MDFYFQSRSSLEKQLVEFIYHKNYSEAIKIALYLEITEENDNFSIYPITLALLIAVQKIEEAKALWDRCPVQIRNSDQALVKLLELANSISNQNFKKSYQLLSSIWPQTIESIIDSIRVEYFHQQLFLISIMFRTISLTDMLERTNIASKEELLSVCANLDWSVVDAGQDTIQPIQLVHPKPLRNNSTCDIFADASMIHKLSTHVASMERKMPTLAALGEKGGDGGGIAVEEAGASRAGGGPGHAVDMDLDL